VVVSGRGADGTKALDHTPQRRLVLKLRTVALPAISPWGIAAAGLLFTTLAFGIYGIGRSLWLDEAWVANSVLAQSLSGMFFYPDWLQTSPPLFLLLTRSAVHAFGVSNTAFRLVPLALALVAVASMMVVSRRLLSPPFATLACSLLAFHPTTIEYSRTCKQYSGELAASAVILLSTVIYLQGPIRRRFYGLAGAFALMLPMAWSTAFLLPGVAIAVWVRGGIRRAGGLVLIAGGVLAILYAAFIRPNLSSELRSYWIANAQHLSPGLLAAVVLCVAAALGAAFTLNKQPESHASSIRVLMQIAAVFPCLLLALADAFQWYPASPRTRLFVLPCFLLVAALNAEDLCRRLIPARQTTALVGAALWLTAIAVCSEAVWKQVREHQNLPQEDFAGAVQFLRQNVTPSDLLLVHASIIEGFKLYTVMESWRDHHAIYGDTGWPCCRRNGTATQLSSREEAVFEDLDRKIPRGFAGRIWMIYSARHTQWMWAGLDEGVLWRAHLMDRGCPPGPYRVLENIAISAMDCVVGRGFGSAAGLPSGASNHPTRTSVSAF